MSRWMSLAQVVSADPFCYRLAATPSFVFTLFKHGSAGRPERDRHAQTQSKQMGAVSAALEQTIHHAEHNKATAACGTTGVATGQLGHAQLLGHHFVWTRQADSSVVRGTHACRTSLQAAPSLAAPNPRVNIALGATSLNPLP